MEAVAGVLGRHWESRNGMSMWRDYGLVEFFYEQRSHGRGWRGSHFSVHMHRLKYGAGRGIVVRPSGTQSWRGTEGSGAGG
jgi:hypothetical protein